MSLFSRGQENSSKSEPIREFEYHDIFGREKKMDIAMV